MKRETEENKLMVVYKRSGDLSEEETQRKLNEIFDILFDETDRRVKAQKAITGLRVYQELGRASLEQL